MSKPSKLKTLKNVWAGEVPPEEHLMSGWEKACHFCVFAFRNFIDKRCLARASALAYTTLLALVPLLVVGISFATVFFKGASGQKQIHRLINHLLENVAPQVGLMSKAHAIEAGSSATNVVSVSQMGEHLTNAVSGTQTNLVSQADVAQAGNQVADAINSAIHNVNSGKLGTVAVIALIFAAISLLSTIEVALNDIWGVRKSRSWLSCIPKYFTAIALGGLLIMAIAMNAGAYSHAANEFLKSKPGGEFLVGHLLPTVILAAALSFFYEFMPNTKVQWKAALAGGAVAGILLQLNNSYSTVYLGKVLSTSKIYGGLAVLPIMLIGMYFSWIIVLLGAQVAHAVQNRRAYIQDLMAKKVYSRGREFIAVRLMQAIARRFHERKEPLGLLPLSEEMGVSSRLVEKIFEPLVKAHLVIETAGNEKTFVPARPLEQISCHDILEAMRTGGNQSLGVVTRAEPVRERIRGELEKIQTAERAAAEEITLSQMVE